ncbi:MAG: hypothetical protein E7329_02945 [Clostridiales bacterium]|nr:hypothetical protein [Clostridiales bacterium]
MAQIIESVEPTEQVIDIEVENPLVLEYTALEQDAANSECSDMAEYYAKKKQALIEEQQEFYRQKKLKIQAEMDAHQDRINQWKIENTPTYGVPQTALEWELQAKGELERNGPTDRWRYSLKQADIAWQKELQEKAQK